MAAGAFLGGATSRLLPASIPFRFFGAAVAYHLLAWLALCATDPPWMGVLLVPFPGWLRWVAIGLVAVAWLLRFMEKGKRRTDRQGPSM